MARSSLWQACLKAIRQQSFYTAYRNTFDVIEATTDAQRDAAYRLRYQVYRIENGPKTDLSYEDAIERDLYDTRAVTHLLVHRQSGEVIGTIRAVMPDTQRPSRSFPAQNVCDHPYIHQPEKIEKLCEISSFCLSKNFRRRPADGRFLPAYHDQDWRIQFREGRLAYLRRRIPYAPLGLLRAAMESALKAHVMECILIVEPEHLRSFESIGLAFRVLGPRVEQHGVMQQPVVFNIKHTLDYMLEQSPHCWDVLSDRGRLHKMANEINLNEWQDRLFDDVPREDIFGKAK